MIGQLVGPYQILEKLGAGGMGEVYLARDTRLGRDVALKRPSDVWLAQPDVRARLHSEASAAGLLTHPNIAAIHDVMDDGAGPFIVMEYVPGESLAQIVQRGPLPVERAVELGIQLADGLAAAHGRGIVHRDLKPGNVIVTAEGQAKILDFGLARTRESAGTSPNSILSAQGKFMGTPGYSSPEQLTGAGPDPGDDIYSLGVLIFELLTGRRPFPEGDAMALALATMTRTPPAAHEVNPAVPRALSAIATRAMARDRRDRYSSAAELRAELRRFAQLSASAMTGVLPDSLRPRRRTAALLAVLALVALSLAVGFQQWVARRGASADRAPVLAVLPFVSRSGLPEDESLATGMRDVLIANLGGQPGLNVLSSSPDGGSGDERRDLRKLAREVGATFLVGGSLLRSGSDLLVVVNLIRGDSDVVEWSASYSGSDRELFSLQERIAEGLAQAGPLRAAVGEAPRPARSGTRDLEALGEFGQAVALLERPDVPGNLHRAEELFRAAISRDATFALAWARLGETYWALYENTRETSWPEKATSAIYEALRLDRDQPRVWISLAIVHHGTGRSDVAIGELHQALELQPNSDDARRALGQVLLDTGRTAEAEQEFRRAIELRPNYWRNHSVLGALYYGTGRNQEAIAAFTRVTELQPDNARGYHNIGTVYHTLGDTGRALEYYEKAIAVSSVSPMPETFSNVGTIHYDEGRYAAAAESFRKAVDLSPNDGLLHGNLGDAYARLGRREEARRAYRDAARLEEQALRINPQDAAAMARLAVHQAKRGEHDEAQRHAARAVELRGGDGEVLYRSAMVHALGGRKEEALAQLERALDLGYSASLAARDPHLAAIQDTVKFRELTADR